MSEANLFQDIFDRASVIVPKNPGRQISANDDSLIIEAGEPFTSTGHGVHLYPVPVSKSWEIDMSDPTDGPADPSSPMLSISKQFLKPGPSSVEIMERKDTRHPPQNINLSSVATSLVKKLGNHHGSLSHHLVLDVHGGNSMLNPSRMLDDMSAAPPRTLTLPHGRSSIGLVKKTS